MPEKRYHPFSYTAPILEGDYPMGGLIAPQLAPPENGPAWRVVVIPGTPSRDYIYYRLLARAPDDMEVVMVRRAGYGGRSYGKGVTNAVLSFDDQVKSIEPVLKLGDKKPTIIMGVSYGGALALKSALEYPDLIHGVFTVAMLVDRPRGYVESAVRLAHLPGIYHALPQHLKNAAREVMGRKSQIGSLFERLPNLTQPVTILHGNRDQLVSLSSAHRLGDYFGDKKDVEVREFHNGTHYMECERPNMIYSEIEQLKARIAGNFEGAN